MQAKTKRRSLFMAVVTAFVAFVAAVLIIPTSTVKADAYYYAEEPAEVTLGAMNVFTWTGSANEPLDNTKDITLPIAYQGFFGGTVGNGKKEGDDWNINANYAFMMDFTETWTGSFMVALGHYDIAIHKEANKIVVGIGGGYGTVDSAAPGLSELTGMQKVNVIHRVIYSDSAKTTPVGMQWTVTVGETFSWSYDRLGTEHVSCKTAHQYYIRNNTGIELGFSLKVPVTYYYENDPVETPLKDFAPQIYTWTDGVGGQLHDFSYVQQVSKQTYYFRDSKGTVLTNPATWEGRSLNVAFQLDFSGNWGKTTVWGREESGHFRFSFGYADVSIHKDANEIVVGLGDKYSIKETGTLQGLSELTGMQKVNIIQKLIYADEKKTAPIAMCYIVKIGSLVYSYDWEGFPYTQSNQMRFSFAFDNTVLFSGLSAVPKSEYTMTFITDDNVESLQPVKVKAGQKLQKPTLTYINEDAILLGYYVNGTDTLFNFDAPVMSDSEIEVRFVDEVKVQEVQDFTAFTYKEVWSATDWLKEGDTLPAGKEYRLCNGNTEVYAQEAVAPFDPSYSVGGIGFKVDLGNQSYDFNESFGWTRTSVYFRVVPYNGTVEIYLSHWNVNGDAEAGTLAPVVTIQLGETDLRGEHTFFFVAEWLYKNEAIVGRRLTVSFDGETYEPVIVTDTATANYRTILSNKTSKDIVFKTIEPELYLEKLQNAYVESNYTEYTWGIVEACINNSYEQLKLANTPTERKTIYESAVMLLNDYPNKEAEALIEVERTQAYTNFAANYKESDYSAENWALVQEILVQAQEEYSKCLNESEIETVTNKYVVKLGEVSTKQEILNATRKAAIETLENSVKENEYTAKNKELVDSIIATYKGLISAEENSAYIQALVGSALIELDEIPVLPKDSSNNGNEATENVGCASSMNAVYIMPIILLFGCVALIKKKEN